MTDDTEQPANWDPIVNGLWRPKHVPSDVEKAAARAAAEAAPAYNPRPSEAAWRAWYDAGGSGGFEPSGVWIARLNRRAY